jgi:hypothetical protein
MTTKQLQKRIEEIWDEMEPDIAGTGVASLIEELIELEIELEANSNQ